ncbi:MAG: DNA repair protein RadC [Patescibacteria group bacterium]
MQNSQYIIRDIPLVLDRSPFDDEYPLLIRDLPPEGKPREKLMAHGPEALTVSELAALLIVTGTTKEDVLGMTNRIIRDYGERNIFAEHDPTKLSKDLDIPIVKACTIVAAGELGRRFYARNQSGFTTIRNAHDVFDYLGELRSLPKEQMRGLYLNSHSRIIRDEVISVGTVGSNFAHPREVFRPALESSAVAVILAHNHPSGEATPSPEDIEITKRLIQAGKLMGIRLIDHVIITKDGFTSVKADY